MQVAFRMLDVNEDGHVDQNEFVKLMGFLRATSPHAQQTRSQSAGVGMFMCSCGYFILGLGNM